jgi:acid phosphatase type 7
MRNLRAYVAGSGAVFLFALGVFSGASCSSGQAPTMPDAGGSGGSAGSGGGAGSGGSSGEGGSSTSCGTGCYAPLGCAYTVTPPSTFAYKNFSVDTSSPVGSAPAPIRVRLGLGGATAEGKPGYADPTTTAVFTWETTEQDSNAKVQMGTSPTSLTEVHTGYAWSTPGNFASSAVNMHEVHVCGLTPATTYYYQVGGGAKSKEVWSATQSFTTVPSTGKITVGVFSDARDTVSIWQTVHQRMKTIGVNFQVITGDIVDIGLEEPEWSQWLSAIWMSGSGFLTLGEQLMVPIAGNHENEAVQFYGNWSIPGSTADGEYAKSYASWDAGNTHFVMYDDTPEASGDSTEASAQQKWLNADLAAADANRAKVPFIVVGSHRGLYSTSFHQSDSDVIQARGVLAPIYDKYHVDLAFNGHDHEYERSNLLNAGTMPTGAPVVKATAAVGATINSTQGTTYIINAGAGADPYPVGSGTVAYRATNQQLCVGSGCAAGTYEGCYLIMELEGSTITLTAYGIKGSSSTDTVIDSLTLTH